MISDLFTPLFFFFYLIALPDGEFAFPIAVSSQLHTINWVLKAGIKVLRHTPSVVAFFGTPGPVVRIVGDYVEASPTLTRSLRVRVLAD